MNDEKQYDEDLWYFDLQCSGKHFLMGNGHTFRGRMRAWCPVKQHPVLVSKSEMGEQSPQTKHWIAGFLHGNQPAPPSPEDEMDEIDVHGPVFRQWMEAIALFVETGYWWSGEPRKCKSCKQELLASEPTVVCKDCRDKKANKEKAKGK